MFKERRNQGATPLFIAAFFFLAIAVVFIALLYSNYHPSTAYAGDETKDSSSVTIDVDYIYPQPIGTVSEVDTEIYLIAYKGGGYTGIEAKKGDKQIANLIANADSLADKPIRLIGKLYNTLHNNEHQIADYGSFMRGQLVELGADSELLDYFADYTYISLSEFQFTNRTYIFECVIVSVLAIIFIVMGIFSRKNNIAAYNELYAAYPETKENFNLLMEKADFHDDVLKIIIYGHHLITYYSGFRAVDLNEAEQIYHYVLTMRRGLIANHSSNLTVLRPNKKKYLMPIRNINNTTDIQLQSTFDYIASHFPHIQLGT